MAKLRFNLPVVQHWSCHNCSGCCRQHAVEVTDEERRRIEGQAWHKSGLIAPDQPLFERIGSWFSRSYRLAHQPDGACVFLDDRGLCRIHAQFGEEAKPLACRIYPYAFHPAGSRIAVSLRFSCPSVVANKGAAVAEQRSELQHIGKLVVPGGADRLRPPAVRPGDDVDWPDVRRIVDALDAEFSDESVPFQVALLRAIFWIDLVAQSRFEKIRGGRLGEYLELVRTAAGSEIAELPEHPAPLSRVGAMQFRLIAAQYSRKDTAVEQRGGIRTRWKLFKAAWRIAKGRGMLPPLQDCFREVPFERLEESFGELPEGTDERFRRYFRVKIQGYHFCGAGYYGFSLVEGFRALALMFPVVLWIARWLTASDDRKQLALADVEQAIAIADHHHGYTPALAGLGTRRRIRMLAQLGDLSKLCVHYSQ